MLDLSVVTAAITANAPSVAQVILPENVDTQGPDSAEKLLSLIEPAVSSRVYPLALPIEPTYPAAVYQLIGTERATRDGYPIIRHDDYAVTVVASTYDAAISAADTMRAAVLAYNPSSAAGTGDVLDQTAEYDQDLDLFGLEMQIRMTHLACQTQTLPVVFVYPIAENWEPGASMTCVDGDAISSFVVLTVAKIPSGGVSALATLRNEIIDAVASLEPGGDWTPVEPSGGAISGIFSTLVLWRDEYVSQEYRSYT